MRTGGLLVRRTPAATPPAVSTRLWSWWDLRLSGYDAANDRFTDQSGRGHHAQLGSTVGADTNDPKVFGWNSTYGIGTYLPGDSVSRWSIPYSAAIALTDDFTIDILLAADAWLPATQQIIVGRWDITNAKEQFRISLPGTGGNQGRPRLEGSQTGSTTGLTATATTTPGFTNGIPNWLRICRNKAAGQARFFTGNSAGTVWTQFGSTVSGLSTSSLFASTSNIEVGAETGGSLPLIGVVHRLRAYASDLGTGSGTPVIDANPQAQLGAEPYTSWVETASGLTVSLSYSTSGRKLTVLDRGGTLFGTDDYLTVADHADFAFAHDDPFSLVVACRSRGTTADQVFMAKKANLTTGAGYALTRGTANAEKFIVADGTVGPSVAGPAFTEGVSMLVAGVRRPVAGTITSRNATAAADNNTAATDTTTAAVTNSLPLYIGSLAGASNFLDAFVFRAGIAREYLSPADLERLAAEWLVAGS